MENRPYQFEWDAEKAKTNLKKHGISFEMATKVFYDESRIEIYDAARSAEEEIYHDWNGKQGFIRCLHGEKREYPSDFRTNRDGEGKETV